MRFQDLPEPLRRLGDLRRDHRYIRFAPRITKTKGVPYLLIRPDIAVFYSHGQYRVTDPWPAATPTHTFTNYQSVRSYLVRAVS